VQPPPGTSLALGVWSGQPWDPGALDAITAKLGRAPKVFLTYVGWDRPFYRSDEDQIRNRGASHVVTWEPNVSLKTIASGGADSFIRAWADGAAAWGHTFYLRPMHEMNGDWYPWGRGVNGNTPADFVNAWRHMHDIFVAEGATNVKWVFSPNVRYGNYPFADLYPGAGYVDWLALDGYNWGLDHHLGTPTWQSFEQIFGATYREIIALAPGKPMMIAETASTENGGDKAQWILKTFLTDVPKYPVVKAVIWFNQADGASNFKIDSSAASLAAFKQVIDSSAYRGQLP
jgi:beta-mannanase